VIEAVCVASERLQALKTYDSLVRSLLCH